MILSSDNQPTIERWSDEALRVQTPLDAIMRLESTDRRRGIRTIVLAGSYANDPELARFLTAFYPRVRVEREN